MHGGGVESAGRGGGGYAPKAPPPLDPPLLSFPVEAEASEWKPATSSVLEPLIAVPRIRGCRRCLSR